MTTRCHALIANYRESRYRVFVGRRVVELTVGRFATEIERRVHRAQRLAIVTACNPGSIRLPRRANAERHCALQRLVAQNGWPHWPASNGAGNWMEPSLLICGAPWHGIDAMAARFGQLATLGWRRGEPVALRIYESAATAVAKSSIRHRAWTRDGDDQ